MTDAPVRRAARVRGAARARAAAMLGAGLIAAAGLAYVTDRKEAADPVAASAKPALMLLTTLPLVFGEQFGLEGGGSPALKALETRYTVTPVGVTDAETLRQGRLLLMAHPIAQPAEALVDLDRWVREGGRLLLLADPALEWPSERPLGDPLRPPPAFADTGLLRHWGLGLDAPDERGPKLRKLGGQEVLTNSPGALAGRCPISRDGLVAHCRIGKGEATIVADADLLNVEDLDGPTDNNLDAVLAELAALER
ncbi:hypothetical protein [Sphingomonas sp.]|uniref:hypothetical protein n=1 Tax=Sphingomonas sp. TaxID=28214 RepID=UPI0017D6364E|nr:hypothetical protein [Sphingomonas sp.]MBA3510786.1 hypothetical protein [Sphingomonas sp.]